MLHKLFRARKRALAPIPITKGEQQQHQHEPSAALRIIHAGGRVEIFYMAVPASRIIDKYPSFMLARPDVFRRPWDAVVRRDEILVPGQKYFVVPPGTVKKLKRRIKKPAIGLDSGLGVMITTTQPSKAVAEEEKNFSGSNPGTVPNRFGILIKSKSKSRARNRRVRFFGIDSNSDLDLSSATVVSSDAQKKQDHQSDGETRKSTRNIDHQWQPSLISISEDQ